MASFDDAARRWSSRSDSPPFAPTSPTDRILSPCSRVLRGPKRMHSPDLAKEMKRNLVDVSMQVAPMPFPCEFDLVLGTTSKFRRQVIDQLGWAYTSMSPDIDEKATRSDDPLELPVAVAKAKAAALVAELVLQQSGPRLVITADQVVLFERQVREKPVSADEARAFLRSYSDKSVSTVSAVVVTHFPSLVQASGVDVATLFWDAIPEAVVEAVVAKGAVLSCAGGFQVEDADLCQLVKTLDGSVDSVMGMPVALTVELLEEVAGRLS